MYYDTDHRHLNERIEFICQNGNIDDQCVHKLVMGDQWSL